MQVGQGVWKHAKELEAEQTNWRDACERRQEGRESLRAGIQVGHRGKEEGKEEAKEEGGWGESETRIAKPTGALQKGLGRRVPAGRTL